MKTYVMMKKWISVTMFGALVMLGQTLYAQGEAGLVFRSASWEKIDEELYYLLHKREGQQEGGEKATHAVMAMHQMETSPVYETKRSTTVRFYRKTVVEGEDKYHVAASVKVPKLQGQYIFLFFPKDPKTNQYNVYAIADSRADSPFGAYQFHNLTKMAISGKLGSKQFKISPDKRVSTVKFNYSDGKALPFGLITQVNGKSKWLARNTYQFNPNKHLKVFIYVVNDVNGNPKVKVKGLVDFFEPKPEELSQIP
ncbi:hypothetical protein SAMN02745181_1450 [Rubritalea squalenifaciens DSM 18772]|uniref:Uncharacterized protein n=1 Tax=Rubritalea squalenifaciens DSM 18772 TaxID=1123071 RepID=A0A1M6HE91_9BACT|nr:hypothetical protein [Rubritalea squalenifaciens]SHJ20449.1 hypothetical protein SAMN02745181_1450 [Rubritalea squalenifaciens DSM 18772]